MSNNEITDSIENAVLADGNSVLSFLNEQQKIVCKPHVVWSPDNNQIDENKN